MSDDRYSTKNMLALRKLTRAVADLLRAQLKDSLATLSYLLRPKAVLGEFVNPGKETSQGADQAFAELKTTYEALAYSKPFNLPKGLQGPLEVMSTAPEISALDYSHTTKTASATKNVLVTSPLKWILSYTNYGPKRLKALLAGKTASTEIQEFVLHTLMLHTVITRQPGFVKLLEALRFPVSTGRLPGFGELPITFVTSALSTVRPPDEVIDESTEVSGTDAFEEVVNLDELAALRDPVKERIMELVKQHADGLIAK